MKKRIIIVSGYFNPLHIGHIEYFKNAKKLADKLFVIVNNDEQRELKGSKLFMLEDEREKIIRELKVVDEVITITHSEAAKALRVLAQKLSIIAEGAGAVAVAAGLKSQFLGSKTVAILSGGNIDMCTFSEILLGKDTV